MADFLHTIRMNFEDSEFPERIRAADPEAIRGVVEAYLQHILNAARASGLDPQRAEDVTQATFATFIEKASSFDVYSAERDQQFRDPDHGFR